MPDPKPGDYQYQLVHSHGDYTMRTAQVVDAFALGLCRVVVPTHKMAVPNCYMLQPLSKDMDGFLDETPWRATKEETVEAWRKRLIDRHEREIKKLDAFLNPPAPKE